MIASDIRGLYPWFNYRYARRRSSEESLADLYFPSEEDLSITSESQSPEVDKSAPSGVFSDRDRAEINTAPSSPSPPPFSRFRRKARLSERPPSVASSELNHV